MNNFTAFDTFQMQMFRTFLFFSGELKYSFVRIQIRIFDYNMLGAKLGDKMMLERMLNENKIQLLPFSDIRGFDTTGMNCAVYITEAQNLDIEMMRLALQRIGEDCIAIIDGDYEAQVDMAAYSGSNNGMRRLSEVFRGSDFYGEVKLQNIYRSRIAALAQEM